MQPIKAQWKKNPELASDINRSYNIIMVDKGLFSQYVTNRSFATVEFPLAGSLVS